MSIESETWAEEAVVSWFMLEPQAAIAHGIEPSWFADSRCRAAVQAIRSIALRGERDPLDHYAVADEMGQRGELVMAWLIQRMDCSHVDRPNWRHWTKRIREQTAIRQRREAAHALARAMDLASDEDERDQAIADFDQLKFPGLVSDDPPTFFDVLKTAASGYAERFEARERGDVRMLSIPTGIRWLDGKLGGGWPRGAITVLAGRTSHGKSTVAQIAALHALRAGHGVHYFSLEDSPDLFAGRVFAQAAGLRTGPYFSGSPDGQCTGPRTLMAALDGAVDGSMRRGLFESTRMPVENLVARVDRYRVSNATALVVVDYLGLLPLPGERDHHREMDIAITRLQQAAIEQQIAYVVVHQLNRQYAARQNKQPMLSDLRDSGAIEERAAAVVFAHRPNVDEGAEGEPAEVDDLHLVLAKNKFGPRNCLGRLRVDFSRYRIERGGDV